MANNTGDVAEGASAAELAKWARLKDLNGCDSDLVACCSGEGVCQSDLASCCEAAAS